MIVRLISASLLLATAATAQNTPPVGTPAPAPKAAPQGQGQNPGDPIPDAKPPQGQNPGQVISELRAEKERLQREIEYARQRAENANEMLAEKLARTEPEIRSIDAGITRPTRPQPMQIKKATMMSADLRSEHGADALLVVDGTPVKNAEFEAMMQYMRSLENTGDDAMRGQRILFELIRTHSVASKFPDNDAMARAEKVKKQLAAGTTVAELVKTNAAVLGAQPDGSVTITRNSFLGTGVEMAAFALAEGAVSQPVRNVFGYVVMHVDAIEKGDSKELDKIQAKAVQIRYTDDQEALNAAQANASRGQVDIRVRDEAVMNMLPAMYRPAPAAAAPASPRASLMKQLQIIEARIEQIGDATETDTQAELKSLQKQRAELQKALQQMPAGPDADQAGEAGDGGRIIPAQPLQPKPAGKGKGKTNPNKTNPNKNGGGN